MQAATRPTIYDFLSGGGEMGKMIRRIDWSKTAAGPVESWPQSLRTAISIMLNAQFPMYIAWGEEFVQFYNDGYRPILGSTKHPAAMGTSTKITFAEIWDIIGPMFEGVMEGKAVGFTDFLLPLDRHGFTEECYFIFSYSPIKQENGLTGGVLVTVTETTERLLGERRLRTLREMGDHAAKGKSMQDACDCIVEAMANNRHDIPFSALYLYDPFQDSYRFSGATGIPIGTASLPDIQVLRELAITAPLQEQYLAGLLDTVRFTDDMPWPELPERYCATLLTRPDQKYPFGLLLLGISPRLRYDRNYSNFFKLLMEQAVTALSTANAFEEERKRAEALAEIDRAKTAFFSNISHEFRTPLTLMLGPLEELLQESSLSQRQLDNADTAHRNAMRLLRLVNSLLDFSRIESGRMQATYRPVDLARLTTDLASNFRSVLEKAGLQLHIDCQSLPESVYVDRSMWEKIVLNLLSNAFKFTLQGSVTVMLRQEGRNAVLKVSDTGVGIPEDELPRMFERFHRAENPGGRSYEGTGIGLSLVSELVGLHQGHIAVESKLNKGSTFSVSIPLGHSHLPAERIAEGDESLYASLLADAYVKESVVHAGPGIASVPASPIVPNGKSKPGATVMIVDDNADMLKYLERVLEHRYTVHAALNGKAALERLSSVSPDLIISDIMMPVMDGVQLLRRVKGDAQTSHIPVMLLSARAGEESRIEGYDLGADDYLVKPFSAKELLARVKAQIQISRTRSHLSALLKHVFQQTPAAITIIRRDNYTVEFANDLYLQLVDKARDFIGKSLFESIPELKNQGIRELLDNVMHTGKPYLGREQLVDLHRQGRREQAYFNFIYHPLREQDGAITGVIVVCFEVTDLVTARKRAEESEILLEAKVVERTAELELKNDQLQQQKDFVETIINSSVDIISVFDPKGRFLMVNRKFEESHATASSAVLGRRVEDVFPAAQHSLFHDFIRDAIRGNARYTKEYQSPVTGAIYELYTVPLRHSNEVYAVLIIAHDCTEVIAASKRLEEKNDQLLKINQELEQFAYIASHDLQEPLRKIRTFSSLLEKSLSLDPVSVRYFEKIHSSAERMSRLIKDLLNYSRLSNTEVHFEDVDLSELLKAVVADFELLIEEKGARIDVPKLPRLKGNPLQLHQLFSNLVSNALKFSGAEPVIDIRCQIVSAEEYARHGQPAYHTAYHEIAIRDNGIGFDQKYSDQVFTIFQRLHDKDTPGTGIGLALCRKIAENHQGSIRVESMPGAGAEFFIYLPLSEPRTRVAYDEDQVNN